MINLCGDKLSWLQNVLKEKIEVWKEGVEFSDIWRVESFPVKLLKYFPPGGSGTQVKLDKYFKTLYSRIEKFWFLNLFHYIPF